MDIPLDEKKTASKGTEEKIKEYITQSVGNKRVEQYEWEREDMM